MQNKYNQFFNFFLFSGLACFSYLSLVLYTDLTPQHQKILISFLGFISVVFIFNLVGFSLIFINRWLKKSYLFFIKKRNKLIINCILIAAILFFMNYATLTICKVLLELPFPFVLSSPGLRLIMIIWLVEIVIVSLSIMNAFYRQLVILHEKTTKLEESSIKAQYTALQNQLNPHFLFNTLQTIQLEVNQVEGKNGKIATTIEELSDILKYALGNSNEKVSFAREIQYLKKYVNIQKLRFGDKFILYYEVDEELMDFQVFRLLLQPIVENSILHGVRYREKGYIKVKIHYSHTEPKVVISVIDSGIGMTKEELQMQRQNMKDYNPNHVGLANVNCRLKLYYGEEAQLHIYSKKDMGTVIRFCLPRES